MSVSKSRFTVAKLDAGMAILLTSDHHLIEFPSLLLPAGVAAGSIIDLNVSQNVTKEKEELDRFVALQNDIRSLFATHPPSTPELRVRNMTQTSVVLEWDLLDLATAEMRSLSLYKNGSKLGKIPNATTTTTKLSGLALDTDYVFQLILRTTAGVHKSNELKVRTHKMTNLTGLNVCLSNVKPEEAQRVAEILARIGAKAPHSKVRIDTTHFVTNRGVGEEYQRAQNMNIPVVVPVFVEACESEGRLMRVGTYYLDSDPSLRPRRPATTASTPAVAASSTNTVPQDTATKETAAAAPAPEVQQDATRDPRETPNHSNTEDVLDTSNQEGGLATGVVDAAKQIIAKAENGLERAKELLPSRTPSENDLGEESMASAAAAAAPTLPMTKEAVEPLQEATDAVIDLPAQAQDTGDEQGDVFPPSMGRPNTEEMEDVAL